MTGQFSSFYARTIRGKPEAEWQKLEDHLTGTARLAAGFAAAFGGGEWGYLAGLWHYLGKYLPTFQHKLRGERANVEHSGLGAALAYQRLKSVGFPLAFAIAGHHGGLAHLIRGEENQPSPLKERLARNSSLLTTTNLPQSIVETNPPTLSEFLSAKQPDGINIQARLRRSGEMWTRFVFSALVDADRLDSQSATSPEKTNLRSRFSSQC